MTSEEFDQEGEPWPGDRVFFSWAVSPEEMAVLRASLSLLGLKPNGRTEVVVNKKCHGDGFTYSCWSDLGGGEEGGFCITDDFTEAMVGVRVLLT